MFGMTGTTSVCPEVGLAVPGVGGGSVASPTGRSRALQVEVWLSALKRAKIVPSLQQDTCSRIQSSLLHFPTTNGLFITTGSCWGVSILNISFVLCIKFQQTLVG